MVNNFLLTQNLTCVLRFKSIKKNMQLTVKFSKYVVMFILLSKVVTLDYN